MTQVATPDVVEAEGPGPHWFQVVLEPHVVARRKPNRSGELYTVFKCNEILEASEVKRGWIRVSAQELRRRFFPENDEVWVLIAADGIGRLLKPIAQPSQELLLASKGGLSMEVNGADAVDSKKNIEVDAWMINQVITENDRAWELLQARRKSIRENDGKTFSMHEGFLSRGNDVLVATMKIEEAKAKCAVLKRCKGFCWKGGADELGPVEVSFKSQWNFHPWKSSDGARFTACRVDCDHWNA